MSVSASERGTNNSGHIRPLFIIGSPRSGTTLLRLMLCSHPEIYVPPECGFAIWWYDKYKNWQKQDSGNSQAVHELAHDIFSSKKFETWNLTTQDIVKSVQFTLPDSYAEVVDIIYQLQAQKCGKAETRWGDKNNFYLNHIDTLRKLFPGAWFIHIVRDIRDITCSYLELGRKKIDSRYAPEPPDSPLMTAQKWNADIWRIQQSFKKPGTLNVTEVRYEDLVNQPSKELRRICTASGISFDPRMLKFNEENRLKSLEPKEFLQWKPKTLEPVSEQSVGRYLIELETGTIEQIENECEENLRNYGYIHLIK